jgi:hypothetical protein
MSRVAHSSCKCRSSKEVEVLQIIIQFSASPIITEFDQPEPSHTRSVDQMKSRWESWLGKHQFVCGGRLMVGPDVALPAATLLLVTGTHVVFLALVYPMLLQRLILVADLGLCYGSLVLLVSTSLTEPGIVPPRVE